MMQLWSYLLGKKRGARASGGANDDGWCMIYDDSVEHETFSAEGMELHHISDKVLSVEDLTGAVGLMHMNGMGIHPLEICKVEDLGGLGLLAAYSEGLQFPCAISAPAGRYGNGEVDFEVPRSGTYGLRAVEGTAAQVLFIGNVAR